MSLRLLQPHRNPWLIHGCCRCSQVMGLVGAVGLTPNCLIFPVVLYLTAYGSEMPRWKSRANVALGVLSGLVGTAAAIGATYSIVVAIMNHDFYS